MEFDELLITTGVDALVRLVRDKQKIELEEATKILNLPQESIEEWARVLEEEGIMRIEYRLTRVYLVWIKPSEEDIEIQKEKFNEQKKSYEREIETAKATVDRDINELNDLGASFTQFYNKAYKRLEEMEKTVASIPTEGIGTGEAVTSRAKTLEECKSKLDDLKTAVLSVKNEIKTLGINEERGASESFLQKVSSTKIEIEAMQKELEELKKKAAGQPLHSEAQMPSVAEIKKKFEILKKEYNSYRIKNAELREDLQTIHESSEILKNVEKSITGSEEQVSSIKKEIELASSEAEALAEKVEALADKARQNADLAERLDNTLGVAKGILTRFPNQQRISDELAGLKELEEKTADKVDAIEKILEIVGGEAATTGQFEELVAKMDDKTFQMRSDLDSLANTLEEEKTTYFAFQKIREKVMNSLETYQKQIDQIEKTMAILMKETEEEGENIRKEGEQIGQMIKKGELQDVIKLVQDIKDKKQVIDEIKKSLGELTETSDNLNKRITLLSNEAKFLEIRGAEAVPAQAPLTKAAGPAITKKETEEDFVTKEKEIRKEIELTEAEELEYRRKRDELKNLIKKLWEDGGGSNDK